MGAVIDRRQFLVTAAALGALGATSGCGGSSTPAFTVLPDTFDFVVGVHQRVAVALADRKGNPVTPSRSARVRIGPAGGSLGDALPTTMHNQGVPAYLLTSYTFPVPGPYTLRVTDGGHHGDLSITAIAPTATAVPLVGRPLIGVPTPTAARPLGVNPICTATPPCPFHAVSLDRALADHRLIALQFATPALCQSRLCGPVVQNLVAVHAPFTDVTFIHAEIYTDLTGQQGSPPVLAYHLQHEPLLFLAGRDGVVRERIDNGYDRAEATAALQRLVASS